MMSLMHLLFLVLLPLTTALFLRSHPAEKKEAQQDDRSLKGLEKLDELFGIDSSQFSRSTESNSSFCPSKDCISFEVAAELFPSLLETETRTESSYCSECDGACMLIPDRSSAKIQCEELYAGPGTICHYPCVKDDRENRSSTTPWAGCPNGTIRTCIDYAVLPNLASEKCKSIDDCLALGYPLGAECRFVENEQALKCDQVDNSLCAYPCVEYSTIIPQATTWTGCPNGSTRTCIDYGVLSKKNLTSEECKSIDNCLALGYPQGAECRFVESEKALKCDKDDNSLCEYDCVEESTFIN